jgi:hypothetical protein
MGKSEGKIPLGWHTPRGEDNIKRITKKLDARACAGLIWLTIGTARLPL